MKNILGYIPEDLSGWKGKWIHYGSIHEFLNRWVRYYKELEIKNKVTRASIKITADTRYWLYINGKRVARGPAKGYPATQPYDRLDITPYLQKGRNAIAVLVHIFGTSTFQNNWRGRAGLLIDGVINLENGEVIELITDSSWKGMDDPARSKKSRRISVQMHFQEIFDARKDITGWTMPGLDTSAWGNVAVFGPAGIPPWHNLEERGIPHLAEEYVKYTENTVFLEGKCSQTWQDESILKETHVTEKRKIIKEGKIKTQRDFQGSITGLTVKKIKKGNFCSILLDLGKSSVGCPRFKINSKKGGEVIDIFVTMRGLNDKYFMYKKEEYSEMAPFFRYTCKKGEQEYELMHFHGLRYVMLTFRDVDAELTISKLDFNFVGYPVKYRGSFTCSDELLNKVWDTARWTMRCCMLDSYVDCPDREQGQWMGDALVEEEVNFYSFGDAKLMRRMLRQCAQSMQPSGLMFGVFPSELYSCILPDYNFTWLIACDKYYAYTGDKTLLAEIYPAAVKNLAWFEKFAGKEGLLAHPDGYWLFLDWSTIDKSGYTAAFNLWWLLGLQSMQRICKILGLNAAPYSKQEKLLRKKLIKTFYDKKKGLWYEAYLPKTKKLVQKGQQANALAFLAGLPVKKGGLDILKGDFVSMPSAAWVSSGLQKKAYDYPVASTYFAQYVLDALFQNKEGGRALDLIRKGWGNMIKKGYTTYLETWEHTEGGWSVCHAWSAHPLTMLSKYVLGIKRTGVSWSEIEFSPVKVKGIDWAKGEVPTPYGNIRAEWKRDNKDKLTYNLDVPKEIKCRVKV